MPSEFSRVSIPDEDYPLRAFGTHPDAAKPLTAFRTITAACNDCGHTVVLDRDRLEALSAVPTFADLWRHAFCAPCRSAGTRERNVELRGEPVDAPRERDDEIFVEDPKKQPVVFGGNRADPYPTLPRSRLMRCA